MPRLSTIRAILLLPLSASVCAHEQLFFFYFTKYEAPHAAVPAYQNTTQCYAFEYSFDYTKLALNCLLYDNFISLFIVKNNLIPQHVCISVKF